MAIIDPDQAAIMVHINRPFDSKGELFIPCFRIKRFADLDLRFRKLLRLVHDMGKDINKGFADAGRAIFVFRVLGNLGYFNPIPEAHPGFMKNLLHRVVLP